MDLFIVVRNLLPWERQEVFLQTENQRQAFVDGVDGFFRDKGPMSPGHPGRVQRPFGQPDAPEEEQPNMFWYEDCSAAAENILLFWKCRREWLPLGSSTYAMHNDIQHPQSFGAFLKGWFKQLWHILTHPWMLLPTVLIGAAWIALGILHTRLGETKAIAILNFFTFAQGGLFGGTLGAVGGILGKLLVATFLNALILPLFSKGTHPFARFGKGLKGLFGSFAFDSLRALSVFLFGLAIALGVYSIFNITQRWQESLVGVVAAVLLVRNIGQRGGLLFSLLSSMVSAFTKGHSPSFVGVTRFLSGMIIGFTLGTGLNAFGLRWCVLIAAGCFLVALIFVLFGKKQRAAFAAVSIVAMLMIPVYAESPSASLSTEQQSQADLKAASKKYATELQPYVDEINRCIAVVQSQNENTPQAEQDAAQKQLEAAQTKFHDVLVHFAKYGNSGEKPQQKQEKKDPAGDQEVQIELKEQDLGPISDEITVIGDGTGNPFADSPDGDFPAGNGVETGTEGDESILTKIGLDEQTTEQIERIATEGWADEDSRVEHEDDVIFWEGVAAGAAVAGAAAGAAGAAGGGGGLPDGPTWDAEEAERREEEGESEDQPTEGGGPDPFKDNPHVTRNPDGSITMTSPSTGERITLEPDPEYGWKNLETGVQYDDNDVNEWVRSQDENANAWQQQAKTNAAYRDAFEKDAADYASHSEQARLDEEVARENARELLEKGFTPEKINDIRVIATQYGIPVDDEDGNMRDIELVKHDTENLIRAIQKMENANQAVYAQEELDASLWLADMELIDNVAEGTVNILGETVPGGKAVKNGHNFLKATLVGGVEAYVEGRSVTVGVIGGMAEGGFTVAQNSLGEVSKDYGLSGVKQVLFEGTANVYLEGTKTVVHELSRGASVEDAVDKAQTAMIKKTGDVAVSTIVGGIMDKSYGGDNSNNADLQKFIIENTKAGASEIYSRAHDMTTVGGKNSSQIINEDFSNWKNSKVESMYLAYYGVKE